MRDNHEHIVNFAYCKFCEHKGKKESQDPCDDCLENSVNVESHRPVHFKDNGSLARVISKWSKKESTNE